MGRGCGSQRLLLLLLAMLAQILLIVI